MKYLLVLGSLLLLSVSYGDGLRCYHCDASLTPCVSGARTCAGADERCYKGVAQAGGQNVYLAGCLAPLGCKFNIEQNYLGFPVSLKTFCCTTDLCNAAAGVRMPPLTGAALAFAWLAYLL
uniref:Sperm acrosome membrane-associated protein 4-like n=1 Tax=Callorhinchus milii TaxID=7868 RepID=A0A4W3H5Z3_CALMI